MAALRFNSHKAQFIFPLSKFVEQEAWMRSRFPSMHNESRRMLDEFLTRILADPPSATIEFPSPPKGWFMTERKELTSETYILKDFEELVFDLLSRIQADVFCQACGCKYSSETLRNNDVDEEDSAIGYCNLLCPSDHVLLTRITRISY